MSPGPQQANTATRSAVRRVLERAGARVDENTVGELVTSYRSALQGLPAPDDLQDEVEQVAGALVPVGQYALGWLPGASDWPSESWGSLLYDIHVGATLGLPQGARYSRLGNEVLLWHDMADEVRRTVTSCSGSVESRYWWSRRRPIAGGLLLQGILGLLAAWASMSAFE